MDCETSESMEENDSLYILKNDRTGRHLSSSSQYNKSMCQYCAKLVVSNNIKRHERGCSSLENRDASKEYTCEKCCKKFFRRDGLKGHMSVCLKSNENASFLHSCLDKQCSERFCFKTSWIEHMKNKHNFQIESPKVVLFNSVPDFYKWKDKEEDKTQSFYTQQSGGVGRKFYFYCQHDDNIKNKNPPKTSRRLKVGSVKKGKRCMSMMHFNIKDDGTCFVKYFPTHSHTGNVELMSQQPVEETCDKQTAPKVSLTRNFEKNNIKIVKSLAHKRIAKTKTENISKNLVRPQILVKSKLLLGINEESTYSADNLEGDDETITNTSLHQECTDNTTNYYLLPEDIEIVKEEIVFSESPEQSNQSIIYTSLGQECTDNTSNELLQEEIVFCESPEQSNQTIINTSLGQERTDNSRNDLLLEDIEIVKKEVVLCECPEQSILNQSKAVLHSFSLQHMKEKCQQNLTILKNFIESDIISNHMLLNICDTISALVEECEACNGESVENLKSNTHLSSRKKAKSMDTPS